VTQTGDRELVLARLRARTASPPPPNPAHPAPAPDARAPEPRSRLLDDGADPVDVFTRTATAAGCSVHDGADLDLAAVAAHHGIRTAVATAEPALDGVVAALRDLGVEVADAADRDAAAAADLGVTACRAAVASTGTVVIGSDVPGARWASLLPRVHLCVVDPAAVVGHPADVLRGLDRTTLPANLALVSGPSRTGDIEQLLTRGVHGPVAVELVIDHPRPVGTGGVH
jgi:L-lactate dehydrogenase complex protein LldG